MSDEPSSLPVAPVSPEDPPESPGQVSFSVPVSEHLGECEVIGDELDGLLDCIPKGAEVSVRSLSASLRAEDDTGLQIPWGTVCIYSPVRSVIVVNIRPACTA